MKKTVEEIIQELASHGHTVWFDQWRDEWKHWRVALDWTGEGEPFFICEKPTMLEAVEMCLDYVLHPEKY